MRYKYRASLLEKLFDGSNYLFLTVFSIMTVLPFLYVVAASFTAPEEVLSRDFILIPHSFSIDAYKYILSADTVLKSIFVTIYVTIVGTLCNLVFTTLMAYPLARKDLLGRRTMMFLILFTMLFSGGMIPTFLIVKEVGLLNSLWSLIIPGAISAFNLIVMKNFFQNLPEGIEESAKIDGCNDLLILIRIVLPLSMPAIATFGLFYAVGHWNSYFGAVLYLSDPDKWPLQVLLRKVVILAQGGVGDSDLFNESFVPPSLTVKYAIIVISTVPILLVYPFLQKHFTKGVLLGSVKG
ncbi:carbohydrate ABC transporter permease [Paenibacillus sp. J5C_2022]|uniref:carbohydrate ABC transporter permease n=1 Tax=Paenibacillus sp. J5C2022 TaxID=2977129 RepID=UPI0021D1E303|nr:carbohydrate ABC transporter permease [Paenibacillus sp. J5C2022]MCU6712748.1 carbohydrate ABC transporter permease [Paenibacillus sp. J5C2022]